MPQTWEFSNIGADCTPEIRIKATNPITSGEKVLLFQAGTGCFGRPVILSTTSTDGQATELVIGFGDNVVGNQSLEIDKNYDNIEFLPLWYPNNTSNGVINTYYSYDVGQTKDQYSSVGNLYVNAICQNLFFLIPNFNLIKDYEPQIIIEKYTPSKGYANRNPQGAGFKRVPLKSFLPINSEKVKLDFRQFEFFRITDKEGTLKSKGLPITKKRKAKVYLQFRLSLKINGVIYTSIPILNLKMVANFFTGNVPIVKERKPINPELGDEDTQADTEFLVKGHVRIHYERI